MLEIVDVPNTVEIFDVALVITGRVLTVNVPEVVPPAMTTLAGTEARLLAEASLTERPLAGADEVIVTVPVEELPPMTESGFNTADFRPGALMIRLALALFVWVSALMLAVEFVATGIVPILNVTDVFPDGTKTD